MHLIHKTTTANNHMSQKYTKKIYDKPNQIETDDNLETQTQFSKRATVIETNAIIQWIMVK